MANLTPTPEENAEVWQWDGVTPLAGGLPTAPLNRQAQALLNMVAWLKTQIGSGLSTVSSLGFKKLSISANGVNANVAISAEELLLRNPLTGKPLLRSNVSLNLNAALMANGSAVAASTWYAIWVDSDGSTDSAYLHTSETTPVPPAGHENYARRRVGWLRTDDSVNKYPLIFKQEDKKVQYGRGGNLTAYPQMFFGISSGTQSLSVNNFCPPSAVEISVTWGVVGTGSGGAIAVGPNSGSAASSSAGFAYMASSSNVFSATNNVEMMLETRNIFVNSGNPNGYVGITGWRDNL